MPEIQNTAFRESRIDVMARRFAGALRPACALKFSLQSNATRFRTNHEHKSAVGGKEWSRMAPPEAQAMPRIKQQRRCPLPDQCG